MYKHCQVRIFHTLDESAAKAASPFRYMRKFTSRRLASLHGLSGLYPSFVPLGCTFNTLLRVDDEFDGLKYKSWERVSRKFSLFSFEVKPQLVDLGHEGWSVCGMRDAE